MNTKTRWSIKLANGKIKRFNKPETQRKWIAKNSNAFWGRNNKMNPLNKLRKLRKHLRRKNR